MLLDNQLLIREKESQQCRMCSNVVEVCQFIYEIKGYQLTALEYKGLDRFLTSVLPIRDFHPSEKRRTLLVASPEGEISEISYKEVEGLSKFDAVPEGYFWLGQIFAGAYTANPLPVARFDFGTSGNKIVINISRKSSEESNPFSVVEELWSQQIQHWENPMIPEVKADLVPFDGSLSKIQEESHDRYRLKIGDDEFPIRDAQDLELCLSTLMGHVVSVPLSDFIRAIFAHLAHFPRKKVSSPVVPYYVNGGKTVYVGGNGFGANRRLDYAGKFFPAFFTGLSGNVVSMRLGAFEDEMIHVLLVRV